MFGVEDLTGKLLFAIIVSAFGSAFQHGYNSGIVNTPKEVILAWIKLSLKTGGYNDAAMATTNRTAQKKGVESVSSEIIQQADFIFLIVVSIYCLGGIAGSLITGFWSDIFGRKWGIVWNNVFVFVSAILMSKAKKSYSYLMLILGRFIIGINCGLNAALVPMYLIEISPTSIRGGVGSAYQLFLTVSILISQGMSRSDFLGTEEAWSTLFGIITVPALLQMIALPFCADSPRYLHEIKRGDDDVKKALMWFRGNRNVEEDFKLIKQEFQAQGMNRRVTLREMFSNVTLRRPLIISCILMLSNQLSGINMVIYYSTSTFLEIGLDEWSAQLGTMFVGFMNMLMTMVSTFIVDMVGRKTLLAAGFGSMMMDSLILCACLFFAERFKGNQLASFAVIVFAIVFVVLFAIGPGSIPWFIVSEMFLQNARQPATSIAVAVNWIGNYIVSLLFQPLQVHSLFFYTLYLRYLKPVIAELSTS